MKLRHKRHPRWISTAVAFAVLLGLTCCATFGQWRQALPGWNYEFPRDHWSHEEFKTEWWYFTGQLRSSDGRQFGYQITFFRQGIRPPGAQPPVKSRLVVSNLSFGHAALADLSQSKFRYTQKLVRGSFGEAGFGKPGTPNQRIAWIDPWELRLDESGNYVARATVEDARLTLTYVAEKRWVPHGKDGVSQKAEGEGRGSHYYSGTRLRTSGILEIGGESLSVTGESWFDHEWSSNQLAPGQVGWDWFSMQFDDGTELMLFQMRLRDGGIDPHSSGTFIDRDGSTIHLGSDEFRLVPTRHWRSKKTNAEYPVGWSIAVDRLGLNIQVSTPLERQELHLEPVAYWEGLIEVDGTRNNQQLKGHGYLEMTGYAGEVVGLSAADPAAPEHR